MSDRTAIKSEGSRDDGYQKNKAFKTVSSYAIENSLLINNFSLQPTTICNTTFGSVIHNKKCECCGNLVLRA